MRKDCPEPSVGRKFLIEVPFEPLPSLPINANKTNGILFFVFCPILHLFHLNFLFVLCKYVRTRGRGGHNRRKCTSIGACRVPFTAFIEPAAVDNVGELRADDGGMVHQDHQRSHHAVASIWCAQQK